MLKYRVLDLTEGGFMIGGKILADLGADVIKVEPPGGSRSRDIGPFHGDTINREKSLYWMAYNANKRSITLDLESSEGLEEFRRLALSADVLLESFKPGYLEGLEIGYEAISKINPRIIMTSVTPFGQDGPRAQHNSCDLTVWASGGILHISGDPDRAPSWVSFPQAYLHGGAQAAAGSLLALHHRRLTGQGQHIDVSTQECLIRLTTNAHLSWEMSRQRVTRTGHAWWVGSLAAPTKVSLGFRCRDGFIAVSLFGGGTVGAVQATRRMVKWMDEEGMAPQWLRDFDWVHDYSGTDLLQETVDRVEQQWSRFFLTKTKSEIMEETLKRRLQLMPAASARDLIESPQLKARDFWQEAQHPEPDGKIVYCGGFAKVSSAPLEIRRGAPLIGQHNTEVRNECGADSATESANRARLRKNANKNKDVLPLDGVKVLEFAWLTAGPLIGGVMANYGATVIRVESHTRLDHHRLSLPSKDGIAGVDRSGYFANWNNTKLSVSLDLQKPRGREIAWRLIQWADVVTESFSAGQMAEWGLGYDAVSKEKPDIIYLSTNQMGQTGPYSSFAGYGHHATAASGITEISGWPDRDPSPPGGVYIDYVAPPFGLSAILACLDRRYETGKGAYIDLAQLETAMQFIAPVIMDCASNGRITGRNGNRLSKAAPHGVYPCKGEDNWVAIGVFTDAEWMALCTAMNSPELAGDPRFNTLSARKKNEDELDSLIGKWTMEFDKEEVESLLQVAGIASSGVTKCDELLADPQLYHRGHFVKMDHPVIGPMSYEAQPYRLSKAPMRMFRAPCLGEHNEFVYKDLLGLTADEIADLLAEGVITTEADLPAGYL